MTTGTIAEELRQPRFSMWAIVKGNTALESRWHPAQPSETERTSGAPTLRRLLPDFSGMRRDLRLNRNAPPNFEVVDCETAR
jgi:hypothetical protein